MSNQTLSILLIFCGLLFSCSDNKPSDTITQDNIEDSVSIPTEKIDTTWVTITPKNYLDFEYSKIIAFATVDPFDYSALYFSKSLDPSKFHDTISVTLNKSQIHYLNDLLSGRERKPFVVSSNIGTGSDCFYPRHNIIFLKKDSIVHYISICFECGKIKQSKEGLANMENMWTFFDSIGLKVFDRPDYHQQYYDSLNSRRRRNRSIMNYK